MVLVDECHHSASETLRSVLQEVHATYVYGVTATPFRGDGLEKINEMLLGPVVTAAVALVLLAFDPGVFKRVDYALLLTFFCFFVFSSSLAANEKIAAFLSRAVRGNEYWWSIGISQIISNVPAAIVLWPFTDSLKALIYGLDTAGLVSVIGSLASVINLRLYTREYPGRAKAFLVTFEKISLAFFAIVVFLQLLLL